jgi:hypothetical protein
LSGCGGEQRNIVHQEYHSSKSDMGGMVDGFEEMGKLGPGFCSLDDLDAVNLGNEVVQRPTYMSAKLTAEQRVEMCELLREYVCCFMWDYTEMPGLSQEFVEHQLPFKVDFRSYKQTACYFKPEIVSQVKEEAHRLLQAGFIWPCRYAEWISNIVPVEKKNTRKIRICVNFRNLNRATPKDEYPVPIADMLIDSALGNRMIDFLDSNVGYNQIFMAKRDINKTAFRCPRFVGLFEWVVMTFGLKNVGATYQRCMNLIFHDLLGVLLEVYIDDMVIKLVNFEGHMDDLQVSLERMKKYGLRMNPMKCAFGISVGRFLGFIVHQHGIQVDPKIQVYQKDQRTDL